MDIIWRNMKKIWRNIWKTKLFYVPIEVHRGARPNSSVSIEAYREARNSSKPQDPRKKCEVILHDENIFEGKYFFSSPNRWTQFTNSVNWHSGEQSGQIFIRWKVVWWKVMEPKLLPCLLNKGVHYCRSGCLSKQFILCRFIQVLSAWLEVLMSFLNCDSCVWRSSAAQDWICFTL